MDLGKKKKKKKRKKTDGEGGDLLKGGTFYNKRIGATLMPLYKVIT